MLKKKTRISKKIETVLFIFLEMSLSNYRYENLNMHLHFLLMGKRYYTILFILKILLKISFD